VIRGKVGQRFYSQDGPAGVVHEVDGFIEGGLGVARSYISPSIWTITHLQSGRVVTNKVFDLRRDALDMMHKLVECGIDWAKSNEELDTPELKEKVRSLGLW